MELSEKTFMEIDGIFDVAHQQSRSILFEHEIYHILKLIGLSVPRFHFLRSPEELTKDILEEYGHRVVLKIVSPHIVHKQKIGGVRIINNHDDLFARYVLSRMKEEVLAGTKGYEPEITGFLVVEFIEFTNSLGNELLIGVKTDRAFGPVVTLSKGGDDAEFFAKFYDPANLFLPHLSYDEARQLAESLKIINKFNEIGHPEYTNLIAQVAFSVSYLAKEYSFISSRKTRYHLKTLDVNPFVFSKKGEFIAVDGYAEFEKEETDKDYSVNTENLEAFFKPDGIAVIGVSRDENKYGMGREIANLIHELGRKDLYCVNLRGGTTNIKNTEYNLYPTLDDIPANIDLAVYTAPANNVCSFFESMKKNIPKAVILIPGIPSDIGYEEFKERLRAIVPEGVRIIGPNCMGIYHGEAPGVNTLFIEKERLAIRSNEKSNVVLLTQSGGMAITLIDKLKSTPVFKVVASFGNKYDVKITDLLKYFSDDRESNILALYVEGFDKKEGRLFFDIAKQTTKPVIVFKGGKTLAGAKAAASHTASMTGDYDTFKAACGQSGVILVEDINMYMNAIKAFSLLHHKKKTGLRAAGVFNAGFEATIASDELGILIPAQVGPDTLLELEKINTHGLADVRNSILDVTPMTDDVMYGRFIEALMKDDQVDCLIVGVVPHVENIKSTPDMCKREDSLANIIVDIFRRYDKPLVVSVNGGEYYSEFVAIMEHAGVPVYSDVRSCVGALRLFMAYKKS
ncbi:MAG: acetate--CoA ligase family protein [Clostridia bacterium]